MIDFQAIDRPVLFTDFEADAAIGTHTFEITEDMFNRWVSLFPHDAECRPFMPPGMSAMVVMRGYMNVIPKRPPGNIHAEQAADLIRLPKIGDTVTTHFQCARAETRIGRKWVYLVSDTRDSAGESLFVGRMTTIWAE